MQKTGSTFLGLFSRSVALRQHQCKVHQNTKEFVCETVSYVDCPRNALHRKSVHLERAFSPPPRLLRSDDPAPRMSWDCGEPEEGFWPYLLCTNITRQLVGAKDLEITVAHQTITREEGLDYKCVDGWYGGDDEHWVATTGESRSDRSRVMGGGISQETVLRASPPSSSSSVVAGPAAAAVVTVSEPRCRRSSF